MTNTVCREYAWPITGGASERDGWAVLLLGLAGAVPYFQRHSIWRHSQSAFLALAIGAFVSCT